MESYSAAYDLLKSVVKKNASYADELVTAMGKLGKFDELYNWYFRVRGVSARLGAAGFQHDDAERRTVRQEDGVPLFRRREKLFSGLRESAFLK